MNQPIPGCTRHKANLELCSICRDIRNSEKKEPDKEECKCYQGSPHVCKDGEEITNITPTCPCECHSDNEAINKGLDKLYGEEGMDEKFREWRYDMNRFFKRMQKREDEEREWRRDLLDILWDIASDGTVVGGKLEDLRKRYL